MCADNSLDSTSLLNQIQQLQNQVIHLERELQDLRTHSSALQSFYSLVENAPDAIVVTDLKGILTYANPAFKVLYGYGEESVGKAIIDFFPQAEYARLDSMMQDLQSHGFWRGTITNVRKDGTFFPSQESAMVVYNAQGVPQAMGAIVRDITAEQHAERERLSLQEQIIAAQQAALTELSTPLIPITDTTVALPLIGSVDSYRAQQVMETLLHGVSTMRARIVILDITGVPLVDTQVANALVQAAQAVKLLGAQVILTGIRPEVAQTLVGLGTHLEEIMTFRSLQDGIAYATNTREK